MSLLALQRAMAKAVIPYRAFREKFGVNDAQTIPARLQEIVSSFLHELPKDVKTPRETQASRA